MNFNIIEEDTKPIQPNKQTVIAEPSQPNQYIWLEAPTQNTDWIVRNLQSISTSSKYIGRPLNDNLIAQIYADVDNFIDEFEDRGYGEITIISDLNEVIDTNIIRLAVLYMEQQLRFDVSLIRNPNR